MTFEITPPIDKRTAGPLTGRAFPEMAEALRSLAEPVLSDWEKYLRQTISPAMALSFNQLRDGLPDILAKMADALASGEPAEVARLVARSPAQGIHRFQVHYDVRDVSTEDRVLRRLLLERVDVALGRRATREEAVALNWALDLMNEQAMVAFVEHQNARLRQAAEAELKYLSFLCHDLRGNLNGVTLWLQVLRTSLAGSPQFADEVGSLDEAQRAILGTMGGMGRILQADRLRYASDDVRPETFDLHAVAASVARSSALQAKQAGVQLTVEVPADATVSSDGELVTLVLQNLIATRSSTAPAGPSTSGPDGSTTPPGASPSPTTARASPPTASTASSKPSAAARCTARPASASALPSPPARPNCSTPS